MRSPIEGVYNIMRFNWHFFVIALCCVVALVLTSNYFDEEIRAVLLVLAILVSVMTIIPLLVSFYVYDLSDLYKLDWMSQKWPHTSTVANFHAGFNEVALLLPNVFPSARISTLDFYDPLKHTEISIKRARKRQPNVTGTMSFQTSQIPLSDASIDISLLFLSAHEIRDHQERACFFKELLRISSSTGVIVVTEHHRDIANFLAYNIGFLHFLSQATWKRSFEDAGLEIKQQIKNTPFITTYILQGNGNSH